MSPNGHCFVDWREEFVSQEHGNRVVHYSLEDSAGNSTLAVVGTERSVRHMFYVVAAEFLNACGSEDVANVRFKWKSRREVLDWLTSLLSKQHHPSYKSEMVGTSPKRKVKANWDEKNVQLFIDICIAEVKAGNRPSTHFNTVGWRNIIEKFSDAVGTPYVYKQLKNKWDMLKKEYRLWLRLIGKETVLEWDPQKKTIAASDEWWDKKLQEVPEASKFRYKGLDNLPKMDFLFKGVSLTGDGTWLRSSAQLPGGVIGTSEEPRLINSEEMMEESGDSFDGPDNLARTLTLAPDPTVKQNTLDRGKKRSISKLEERKEKRREHMCEAVESRTTAASVLQENFRNTVEECVRLLNSIPEIERCSDIYLSALELFAKKEYRDIFVAINDNGVRVAWLRKFHS